MVEINYNNLDSYLKDLNKASQRNATLEESTPAPVYLIHGEEMLYKRAFKKVLNTLVPPLSRSMNYEPVDGAGGSVYEAIEKVNTFSLLSGRKVVALLDARIFDSKRDIEKMLDKARQGYDSRNMSNAATHLLRLMALLNVTFDDVTGHRRRELFPVHPGLPPDDRWLVEIVEHCRQTGRSIPGAADSEGVLHKAIEKGFPKANHLIITTDIIDKRKKLYRTVRDSGVIIDCSVPKGDRKADKRLQAAVLQENMNAILAESRKTIEPGAFEALYGLTGFDLRTFSGNLKKLIAYVGNREQINRRDIEAVLKRTKQDPIYEFTNAIASKNRAGALFYMSSLLSDARNPMRPEQILVAVLNQIRKLLRVKEFTTSAAGRSWFPGCPYGQFRNKVLPAIQVFDTELSDQLRNWRDLMPPEGPDDTAPAADTAKRKKGKLKTDLLVVKNPNNPYPVYQLFLKSDRFSMEELLDAFDFLSRTDLRIKSGSENKKLILEELIFNICK